MRIPVGILASLLLFSAIALPCAAQQSSQNPDQNQNSSQSQNQSKDQTGTKSQPDKSQPADKRPSTAEDNPFPEDISKKAATAAGNSPDAPAPKPSPTPRSDAEKPSAPSSSKPDYSSSRSGLRDLDSTDPDARISDGAGGYIHDPRLAAQDVKIGQFYLVNQEYKGAYSRFKEATKVDPGNADAVYGLAEAARGLKLNNEAADNYRIYLDAFPDGPKAKSARKALAQLGEAPKK
jgi:tetratricopeptide (TPR) repeat protein